MANEETIKRLVELLKLPGNDACADCDSPDVQFAAGNLGVFLCKNCATLHQNLGSHISIVRSLYSKSWHTFELNFLENNGNTKSKSFFERYVPSFYRRVKPNDPLVLREEWIRAKYERKEFLYPERQEYTSGRMEGWLWKKDRESDTFNQRWFSLNETENTLKYFVKNAKEPKLTIKLTDLNATFCPSKMKIKTGLQLIHTKNGERRNIYVYAEEGKVIVAWYTSLRAAKFASLQVAFPHESPENLTSLLMHDFTYEGWLWKTGPSSKDPYKRRWFTLDRRRLVYFEQPLDAVPKGEIFLGGKSDGFAVRRGIPPGLKEKYFGFIVKTPNRVYLLGAENHDERAKWLLFLQEVVDTPLGPLDYSARRQSS